MKCKHCGGRQFRCIARFAIDREYDENDEVVMSEIDDALGDEEDSHMCMGCDKEIKDSDLIPG